MKWMRAAAGLTACAALTVAGCADTTDQVLAPDEPLPEQGTPALSQASFPSLASATLDDLGGQHLVVFESNRRVPKGFDARVEELGATVESKLPQIGVAVVSGLGTEAAQELQAFDDTRFVEVDLVIEMELPDLGLTDLANASPASPADPTGAFFWARQWDKRAIHAPEAWSAGYLGSSDVTVAILDTGIDYMHADLFGLVDLGRSASFVPLDDFFVSIYFPTRHPVTDLHYHGTHVSATVASNAFAAAGVTSGVTLIGVKVCSVVGGCEGSAIFGGFVHAVESGADVINMSLGGHFEKSEYPGAVAGINRLFNYAKRNAVTIVVSAGNDAIDLDHDADGFKTYCDAPHVICVSATAPASSDGTNGPWYDVDTPTPYTNFGRSAVSVAAPGGYFTGWVWAACSTSSLVIPICQTGTYIVGLFGTSMASPHTAGLAALMVERYGKNPGRIKTAIQKSADDLGQPGVDPWYGKGRINVVTAVGAN